MQGSRVSLQRAQTVCVDVQGAARGTVIMGAVPAGGGAAARTAAVILGGRCQNTGPETQGNVPPRALEGGMPLRNNNFSSPGAALGAFSGQNPDARDCGTVDCLPEPARVPPSEKQEWICRVPVALVEGRPRREMPGLRVQPLPDCECRRVRYPKAFDPDNTSTFRELLGAPGFPAIDEVTRGGIFNIFPGAPSLDSAEFEDKPNGLRDGASAADKDEFGNVASSIGADADGSKQTLPIEKRATVDPSVESTRRKEDAKSGCDVLEQRSCGRLPE